jgi:hypothetical protein
VAEHVETVDLGVIWHPNDPEAVLLVDQGLAVLALGPHFDDADQSCVVLTWRHSYSARIGSPNDEGLVNHALYGKGLESVRWAGTVIESSAVWEIRKQSSDKVWLPGSGFVDRPIPTHFVLLTKDCTVEVVADAVEVQRLDGTTREAALAASDIATR